MGRNNDVGVCNSEGGEGGGGWSSAAVVTTTSRPSPPSTTTTMTPSSSWSGSSVVDCSVEDGLYPDPDNCRGFIKCAQV